MGVIIGFLMRIITFPGVLMNIWVTILSCKMLGIKITKVDWRYFLMGMVVKIEPPENYLRLIALVIWPFLFMTIAALPFCYLAALEHIGLGMLFNAWLAISMAANSFPEITLGNILWKQSNQEIQQKNYIAYIGFPLVILIYAMMLSKLLYLDILYGGFLVIMVDKAFF